MNRFDCGSNQSLNKMIALFKGAQKPGEALAALAAFEAKLNKVKEDRENMMKAKGALEMAEPILTTSHAAKLDVAVEELSDLKGQPIYRCIYALQGLI